MGQASEHCGQSLASLCPMVQFLLPVRIVWLANGAVEGSYEGTLVENLK